MKNIYEVLRQKEADIERLKGELQALRVVAPLLQEESAPEVQVAPPPVRTDSTPPARPANSGGIAAKIRLILDRESQEISKGAENGPRGGGP
jgi:hypothetical protein